MRVRTFLLVLCIWAIVSIASALPASSATRRVVLLFDERPELPGLTLLQADLVRTLTSSSADRIEVYNETMDQSRFSSGSYQLLLRDFLRAKYSDKKIDVVIAILAPSLNFLLDYGAIIFLGRRSSFAGSTRQNLATGCCLLTSAAF